MITCYKCGREVPYGIYFTHLIHDYEREKSMKLEELIKRFTYHPPYGNQPERYKQIRQAALDFASIIVALTPESREQSLAITALEECVMRANAAIAVNESVDPNTLYPDVLTTEGSSSPASE